MKTKIKADFQICISVPLKTWKLPRGMLSFVKSYTQIFMTRYLFLEISENRNTAYLILVLIMQCKWTHRKNGTQNPMRTQDPGRTHNPVRIRTLWRLWIHWWPRKDPGAYKLAKVSWFPHHVFNLVEFTVKGRFICHCWMQIYLKFFMVSSPLIKMGGRGGGLLFRASGGSVFSYGQWGHSFIWGKSQLGISLGGPQYQFLAQLTNAGPNCVKVNLTNCHREVCRIKFHQTVTSDVLTSLWQFDKMLFW